MQQTQLGNESVTITIPVWIWVLSAIFISAISVLLTLVISELVNR